MQGYSTTQEQFNKQISTLSSTKQSVEESLNMILTTRQGERACMPDYGSPLMTGLFDQLDYASWAIVKNELIEVIKKYEPRVEVSDIQLELDNDNYIVAVNVDYDIIEVSSIHQDIE